jgi:hypothetical protein
MPVIEAQGRFQAQSKPVGVPEEAARDAPSTPLMPPLMSPDRGPHLPMIRGSSGGGGPESDRSLRSRDEGSLTATDFGDQNDDGSYTLASSATLMQWTQNVVADKKLRHAALQGDVDRVSKTSQATNISSSEQTNKSWARFFFFFRVHPRVSGCCAPPGSLPSLSVSDRTKHMCDHMFAPLVAHTLSHRLALLLPRPQVRAALGEGAFVDCKDKYGNTPLLFASARGRVTVVRELLKCGADIDLCAPGGMSPLHAAAKWGKAKAVRQMKRKSKLAKGRFRVVYHHRPQD